MIVYEPNPRLFAAGNPRDRQTGGRGGAITAVVMLALGVGPASLYSLLVFPYASDACGDSDRRLICTATWQQVVSVGPLASAAVGVVVAVCSLSLRSPFRALGIALGYVIGWGGFFAALAIASQR